MKFVSALFRIIVGVVFGVVAAMALSPAAAAFNVGPDSNAPVIMLIAVALSAVLAFFAPTIRRAFGRGFLLAGISFIALPISMMLLSGRVASDMVTAADANSQGATAVGAGIAGIAMTGAATFIGLIVGAIFIVIGLVLALGGRREVIIVESRAR